MTPIETTERLVRQLLDLGPMAGWSVVTWLQDKLHAKELFPGGLYSDRQGVLYAYENNCL